MAVKATKECDHYTYEIKCEYCGCEFEYEKEDLGYRPWYPHGFIYCPHCNKPLRHQEYYKKTRKRLEATKRKASFSSIFTQ